MFEDVKRVSGDNFQFGASLELTLILCQQQGMKALLREGIPRSCRSEVWKR